MAVDHERGTGLPGFGGSAKPSLVAGENPIVIFVFLVA
jgi:hypothetical protein